MEKKLKIFTKYNIILSVSAFLSGIVNGLIGTGGGIVLYFALRLMGKLNVNETDKKCFKDLMAEIITAIIPMCIVSSIVYMIKKEIVYPLLPVYISGAVAGGILGALLLKKIKTKFLKKIFAGLIIFAGIKMLTG